jgi:Spy/CpxP family protein refolding chaperone
MNTRLCALAAVFAVAAVAWSQAEPAPGGGYGGGARKSSGMMSQAGPPRGDAMMDNFFPPELVMRHQKEIGLTADQQKAIRAEMLKTAPKFMELQWQQSDEEETMQALLKQAHPEEKAVLAQLDKLLAVENELKRAQLGNLVRIKNILTPEQQAMLTGLKQGPRTMPPGMGMGMPGGMGGAPGGAPGFPGAPARPAGAGQQPPSGGEGG